LKGGQQFGWSTNGRKGESYLGTQTPLSRGGEDKHDGRPPLSEKKGSLSVITCFREIWVKPLGVLEVTNFRKAKLGGRDSWGGRFSKGGYGPTR